MQPTRDCGIHHGSVRQGIARMRAAIFNREVTLTNMKHRYRHACNAQYPALARRDCFSWRDLNPMHNNHSLRWLGYFRSTASLPARRDDSIQQARELQQGRSRTSASRIKTGVIKPIADDAVPILKTRFNHLTTWSRVCSTKAKQGYRRVPVRTGNPLAFR